MDHSFTGSKTRLPYGLKSPDSSLSDIVWPAIPSSEAATMFTVMHQLEQSQWLPEDELKAQQFRQLGHIIKHAFNTVPFYRERFQQAGIDPLQDDIETLLQRLPVLKRAEIQAAGDNLYSTQPPESHGKRGKIETSGSTGRPIRVLTTALTQFFWRCFTLRDNLWHRSDFSAKLATIRHADPGKAEPPHGIHSTGWGPATSALYKTGPAALLSIRSDISVQARWLQREAPAYLLSYPSNLLALAHYFENNGLSLPSLKEVRTISEALGDDLRATVSRVWGVPLVDMYTSQETGYIALQCPDHEHYHVQSENMIVEILDENDRPCAPGSTGRVVVTGLHNFAMPLLRYDIGDYAEAGSACPCGRGLPVINRIFGRVRNMLVLPNGEQRWPTFGPQKLNAIAPVNQVQVVQKTVDRIEVRLVTPRTLTDGELTAVSGSIQQSLGHPFHIDFVFCDEIERGRTGKFEEFRSEIAGD
jgi:phenylacetate-CoA ligase